MQNSYRLSSNVDRRGNKMGETQPQTKLPELSTGELTLIETRLINEGKSVLVAYLFFVFIGGLGAHNFYIGRTLLGIIELLLFLVGVVLISAAGLGLLLFIPLVVLLLIDLFIIPGGIRKRLDQRRNELIAAARKSKLAEEGAG